MEPSNILLDEPERLDNQQKVYSVSSIWWATFLGSSLAGAYLMSKNAEVLNKSSSKLTIWLVAIIFLILGVAVEWLGFLQDFLPVFIQIVGMRVFAQATQQSDINQFTASGGQEHSVWRGLGIALIFLSILLLILGSFYLLLMNFTTGSK